MSSNQQALTPEHVLATLGYRGFVKALFSRSGDQSKDFTHAILGVATELNELGNAEDRVNSLEELGDLEFYGVAALNLVEEFLGRSVEADIMGAVLDRVDELSEALPGYKHPIFLIDNAKTDLLDACKRWVGYGKQPADLVATLVQTVALVIFAGSVCDYPETDREKVRLVNAAKLLERYKGLAFNAEHAVNRDVAAERALLESHAA